MSATGRIPYLDHRSISQWNALIQSSFCVQRICTEIHCVCQCHRPNSISGSPVYLPVKNPNPPIPVFLYVLWCIRVYTVVRICMTMYVRRANDALILIRLKIHWNKSGGTCSLELLVWFAVRCENSYSLMISIDFLLLRCCISQWFRSRRAYIREFYYELECIMRLASRA